MILNAVVKALEGSSPFYSFSSSDGLYVATGFVVVPLEDEIDEFTLGNRLCINDEGWSRGGRS